MKKREYLEARTQQVYDGHSKIISLPHEINELKNKVRKLEAELEAYCMDDLLSVIDEGEQEEYNDDERDSLDPCFSPPLTVKNVEEIVLRMIMDIVGSAGSA